MTALTSTKKKKNLWKTAGAFLPLLLASLLFTPSALAAKIVLANDEWIFSNLGFSHTADSGIFATNIGKWFTDGRPGKFHAYSTNFGLIESSLANAMTGAGNKWTTGIKIKFDLPTLLTYDGIFLAGNVADNQVLIDYVKAGGNVYIAAGTGWGGEVSEAARWNTFLNNFGLGLEPSYNTDTGKKIAINSQHPIFQGVSYLWNGLGNATVVLNPDNRATSVVLSTRKGLYAVYDDRPAPIPVPESSSGLGASAFVAFGIGGHLWSKHKSRSTKV